MKFRLSNGYTYAVEFSARNFRQFRRELNRAYLEFTGHRLGFTPMLHVYSPNAQRWVDTSSDGYRVVINPLLIEESVWQTAITHHDWSEHLDEMLNTLLGIVTNALPQPAPGNRRLRRVK